MKKQYIIIFIFLIHSILIFGQSSNFKHFTTDNGLLDNKIYGITQDNHGNLWVATAKGLMVFNQAFQSFKHIDLTYINPQPELTSALKFLSDGRLFVGTKSGFYIFNPNNLKDENITPNLQITSLCYNSITHYISNQ